MIQVKCIQKFRSKSGVIYGYRLIDLNGQTQDVNADVLKNAIKENKIHVVNLKLTSDNRLVDYEEKILKNTEILGSQMSKPKAIAKIEMLEDRNESAIRYIFDKLKKSIGAELDYMEEACKGLWLAQSEPIGTLEYGSIAFATVDCIPDEIRDVGGTDVRDFEFGYDLRIGVSIEDFKDISIYIDYRTFAVDKYRSDFNFDTIDEGIEKFIKLYNKYNKDDKVFRHKYIENMNKLLGIAKGIKVKGLEIIEVVELVNCVNIRGTYKDYELIVGFNTKGCSIATVEKPVLKGNNKNTGDTMESIFDSAPEPATKYANREDYDIKSDISNCLESYIKDYIKRNFK